MDLKDIRKELDGIDEQIAALYEKRMKLSEEVAESKRESGKNVYDKEREQDK